MTYATRETSRYSGQPVECYRFSQGANLWLWTSADRPIVLPSGTYAPHTIQRSAIEQSQEDQNGNVEVRVPYDNPVAALFIAYSPTTPVSVVIYRAHRDEESSVATVFPAGQVASVKFEESEAILTCSPVTRGLRRRIPSLLYQSTCNWALYGPGCTLDKNAHRDICVTSSVTGLTVVSADFAARANGWFTNGWLEVPGGERRWVVDHVGSTITLLSPFATGYLTAGQTVQAYWGCDRTETTCAAKFNNLVNHLGFPRVPLRNPFVSGAA